VKTLGNMLEEVSVHPAGDIPAIADIPGDHTLKDWYAVSTDDAGGVIAYFRDESTALRFRLDYINDSLNPLPKR